MDYLKNDENLLDYYNYDKNSEEYQKYLTYLNYYFSEPSKKDKYKREYENGNYILIDKNNKKIIIEPSKFVNLNKLYNDLEVFNNIALEKISIIIEKTSNFTDDDRKEFKDLKEKYSIYINKIKEIDLLNNSYYDELEKNLSLKFDLSVKLAKFYLERRKTYNEINIMIEKKLKNELIKIYKKNNKSIPNILEINKIAKKNEIPSKEIELWFNWIDNSAKYVKTLNEIYKLNEIIKKNKEEFEIKNDYMLIKKPNIII